MTARFRERAQPCCGAQFDAATAIEHDGAVPVAGDMSVCAECGAWLVFVDDAGGVRLYDEAVDGVNLLGRERRLMHAASQFFALRCQQRQQDKS